MSIPFSLQEVVIVTLLVKEVHVVVLAIVADLLHHSAHAGFVVTDQFCVFCLLALELFDQSFLFDEGSFEFGDSGSLTRH